MYFHMRTVRSGIAFKPHEKVAQQLPYQDQTVQKPEFISKLLTTQNKGTIREAANSTDFT